MPFVTAKKIEAALYLFLHTFLHRLSMADLFVCVAATARCCYLLLPPRGDSTPPLLLTNRHVLRALRARSTRRRLLTSSGPVSSVLMKGKRLPRCCCRAAAAALLLPRRCCCCCCTLPLCALPLYFVMSPTYKAMEATTSRSSLQPLPHNGSLRDPSGPVPLSS